MEFIAIIPARYASTRFPGKPLALLGGIPIIQHVYERVSKIIPDTFVATDDERIGHTVDSFGGKYVMTSVHHHSGTDRCEEAVSKTGVSADIVINVQGDEPFITADQIKTLCQCFDDSNTDIATLVKPFTPDMGYEESQFSQSRNRRKQPSAILLTFHHTLPPRYRRIRLALTPYLL